jgi:hypothetical protein
MRGNRWFPFIFLRNFQGFSEAYPSLGGDHHLVGTQVQPTGTAFVRDAAVRKLRDVTIAIAVAAAAGVGVIGWVSAATIPGSSFGPGPTGNAATGVDDQPINAGGDGFAQAPQRSTQFGPGVAVSGGSR